MINKKLIAILLSLFIVVSPFFAIAGLPAPVVNYAISVGNVLKQAGSSIRATVAFRSAANDALYTATANVSRQSVAKGVLGRFATLGLGMAGGAVLVGLLEGVDWVMDPENNTIRRPVAGTAFWCQSYNFSVDTCFLSADDLIHSYGIENNTSNNYYNVTNTNLRITEIIDPDVVQIVTETKGKEGALIKYDFDNIAQSKTDSSIRHERVLSGQKQVYVIYQDEQDVDMTADDLAELFDNLTDDELAQLMQPDPNLDPANDPMLEVYEDIAEDAELDTAENPEDNECSDGFVYDAGNCLQEAEPQSGLEFPDFCTWAEKVCNFIDFISDDELELEESDIPESDTVLNSPSTFDQSYITAPSECPPDINQTIPVGFQSFSLVIPMTPVCNFGADIINPIVIFLAYIQAALMIGSAFKVG